MSLGLLATSRTGVAETLTEAEVIRLVGSQAPQVVAAREAISVAEAAELGASLYPNPSLSWEREHFPAGSPATEDSLSLTVPIELAGRRRAQSALARSGTASARARATRTQSEAVTEALSAFYAVLASEREVAILSRALVRLEEAVRVIARRHEEGTTSGYERARLEIEAELSRSQLRQAEASSRAARAGLAARLGMDQATLQLRGALTTSEPVTTREQRKRPSLRFLGAAEAAARDAHAAAGWAWVPTLSLTGGLLFAEASGTKYGYVAGLSLSLPIFSRGQELAGETAARQRLAAAEIRAFVRQESVEAARAREQLLSARAELVRFNESTRERVELLERAALSGYREGDRSVAELVDAERARTEVDRQALELECLAKQAELALRRAQGEFE